MGVPLIKSDYGPRGKGRITDRGDTYLLNTDKGSFVLSKETGIGKFVSKVVTDYPICYGLSSGLDQLRFCGPWNGIIVARYKGILVPEGANVPTPRFIQGGEQKTNRYGGTYTTKDKWVFSMLFNLETPPFEGVETSKRFDYSFVLHNGEVAIKGGKLAKMLYTALETMGMDMERTTIPPQENVLPWLDQKLREWNRQVQLKFEEGWINDINPMPLTSTPVHHIENQGTTQVHQQGELEALRQRLAELEAERKSQAGTQATVEFDTSPEVNPGPPVGEIVFNENAPVELTREQKAAMEESNLPGMNLDFKTGVE